MLEKKKGGVLGFLGGGPILGSMLQGQEGGLDLVKKVESAGKRAGAVYKRQKILDAKLDTIAEKLGITFELPQISVDYGQTDIAYFQKLIKEVEDNGEDIGLLTKISAMKRLLSLLSKMSKNTGAALEDVQRTMLKVDVIIRGLVKRDKKRGPSKDSP